MGTSTNNVYKGNRYVPKLDGEWNKEKEYEPLIIVSNQGNSYTSKTFVPKNIDIFNENFWVCTGNYNAQVELYRQETKNAVATVNKKFDDFVQDQENIFSIITSNAKTDIEQFIADKHVNIDDDIQNVNNQITQMETKISVDYNDMKTDVENYVNDKYQEIDNEKQQIENIIASIDLVVDGGMFGTTGIINIMDGGTF